MTEDRLPLAELLAKAGDSDFLRSVAEAVVQLLMETDVEGLIGAGRHERSGDRTTYRNGYRDRTLDTRLGSLQLRIPKLRQGSYFPVNQLRCSTLEPRSGSTGSVASRRGASTTWCKRWDWRGSARAPSASCARISTTASAPSSTARSAGNGPISGWMRPT